VLGLSDGKRISTIRQAALAQYSIVTGRRTDRQTERRTDRHLSTANAALMHRAGKNLQNAFKILSFTVID